MTSPTLGRAALAMQRLMVASGRGSRLYEAVARTLGAYLARGLRASAYARGSVAARDVAPGLSDVDLLLVVDGDVRPARERWERLQRAIPPIGDLARVVIYDRETVRERAAATALTHGLEEPDGTGGALYYGERPPEQDDPLHHRPGLRGAGRDWRLLYGPERRPLPGPPDPHQDRIAAWLEVQSCWRHVFRAVGHELAPTYRRYLLPKLVADLAGVWLAVDRGQQVAGRADALRRGAACIPGEADHLALASEQLHPRATPVGDPLMVFLPSLVGITRLVADRLGADLAAADAVDVRLIGGERSELVVAGDASSDRLLPLSDWRSVALGAAPDHSFAVAGHPCDAGALRAAVTDHGPYRALHGSGLLVLPSDWTRGIFRAVQFAGTDPVSFALLDGAEEARFPEVPGWSARDWARRGVAEHAGWLAPANAPGRTDGQTLGILLTAARVALFADSLATREPFLAVSAADTAARLASETPSAGGVLEQALGEYRAWRRRSELPDPATVDALERTVVALPSYGGTRPTATSDRRPSVSRDVALYVGGDIMPWSPRDIDERGLGGSETAAVRAPAALAELGYSVTVYANVAEPGTHFGVEFTSHDDYDPERPRRTLICLRELELLDRPQASHLTMLWMQDEHAGRDLTAQRAGRIDRVLAVSAWQARRLAEQHSEIGDRIQLIRNGIEPSFFLGANGGPRDPRVVFSSQPERGLDILLELWPRVRERVPDAELVYCHAPVYDWLEDRNPRVAGHRDLVRKLSQQPGVVAIDPLPQRELAELLERSRVWAHPSWSTPYGCPFYETSCIGAMEAQAAGAWPVASAWGALPETVRTGALVATDGAPAAPWRERFLEEVVAGLTDEGRRRKAERARSTAVAMDWRGVARSIAETIEHP